MVINDLRIELRSVQEQEGAAMRRAVRLRRAGAPVEQQRAAIEEGERLRALVARVQGRIWAREARQ